MQLLCLEFIFFSQLLSPSPNSFRSDTHGLNYGAIINFTEKILLVACSSGNSLFIKHHAELQLVLAVQPTNRYTPH